jgi:ribosomal protein S18 acetylase RimI-like enzyme
MVATWDAARAAHFFQAYEAAFRERPGFPRWRAAQWIGDYLENENARHDWSLLAQVGEMPVGFVLASAEKPEAYIMQIGVIPPQRRRGLASALIIEATRRMQTAGETTAQLLVNVNNPSAIHTYTQLGFVTTGRRARYEQGRFVHGPH